MKKITLLALLLCCAWLAKAQDDPMMSYANGIQEGPLKAHLSILASDEYEGRETGEKGQKMAAEYIKKHFEAIGLKGPVGGDKPYYQSFNLYKSSWESGKIQTALGQPMMLFEDFFPYGSYTFQKKTFEAVFVGYGLDGEGYSDYRGLDVKGKAVVVLEGEPKRNDGTYWSTGSTEPSSEATTFNKIASAKANGASFVVIAYGTMADFERRNKQFKAYYQEPSLGFDKPEDNAAAFGLAFTSPEGAARILGTTSAKLNKVIAKIAKKGTALSGKMTSKVTVEANIKKEPVETENVLGYLEGTDKKDELLVITAHYDHVGIIDGEVYNGADDDGSGTVAVLEIAKAFAKAKAEGHGPRRSILFMTVTGEEKGLLGSQYYSENPLFALEKTVVNLNTDMIGRIDEAHEGNPNYVYVIGSDMLSSDLHSLHAEVAKRHFKDLELDYTYNNDTDPNRYYYRSDHYNFAKNNIPVIFYFNGTHADYHKATDTIEKIHFGKIAKISQLTFCTAWVIANREARLEVDKAKK